MSGYKLRIILENAMVPRRKISNGVLYPLLDKLESKGCIGLRKLIRIHVVRRLRTLLKRDGAILLN